MISFLLHYLHRLLFYINFQVLRYNELMFQKVKIIALFFGFIITSVSLFFNYFLLNKVKDFEKGVSVLGVLDGDTIVTDGKTRLRLRLIDAPELNFCGGQEAKKELEKLVLGKQVKVEETIIDLLGRPMSLVYVDDKLINLEMVRFGWATFHADGAVTANNLVKQAAATAKDQKLGLFSLCRSNVPSSKNCLIKGNIDPSDSKKKIYYLPGCVQYNTTIVELDRGEAWFCLESEARAEGYLKSQRCP